MAGGQGGSRPGAGRPIGSTRVYIPRGTYDPASAPLTLESVSKALAWNDEIPEEILKLNSKQILEKCMRVFFLTGAFSAAAQAASSLMPYEFSRRAPSATDISKKDLARMTRDELVAIASGQIKQDDDPDPDGSTEPL